MQRHNEILHAHLVTRANNQIAELQDVVSGFLRREDKDGKPLPGAAFGDLKKGIEDSFGILDKIASDLSIYISVYSDETLLGYTEKSFLVLNQDVSDGVAFARNISKEQINDLDGMSLISSKYNRTCEYVELVVIPVGTPLQFALIMNDWLDVASYALRYIDHKTGEYKDYGTMIDRKTDQPFGDVRYFVRSMLSRFRFMPKEIMDYPENLQNDVKNLQAVKDWVMREIDSWTSTSEIADYIDANTEKTPQLRRLWAL